jgi:hypothetical protein
MRSTLCVRSWRGDPAGWWCRTTQVLPPTRYNSLRGAPPLQMLRSTPQPTSTQTSVSPSFCEPPPPARSCIPYARSPLAYGMVWDKKGPKNKSNVKLMWRSRYVVIRRGVLSLRSVGLFPYHYVLYLAYWPISHRTYTYRIALHLFQLSHSHLQLRPRRRQRLPHPHSPRLHDPAYRR